MEKYACKAITITLAGDYEKIYERFTKRNESSERHRGHVVNDSYPEKDQNREVMPISYEGFVDGIKSRGMDSFQANGPQIVIDTTDLEKVDLEEVVKEIMDYREKMV